MDRIIEAVGLCLFFFGSCCKACYMHPFIPFFLMASFQHFLKNSIEFKNKRLTSVLTALCLGSDLLCRTTVFEQIIFKNII